MAYIALYRKWRPGDFQNLVGQEHISRTLSNAIQQGKIAHAYLFSGPRGTGKTSTAKILAKALNCDRGPTPIPCNDCANCRRINDGSSMDVLEIDAASNRGIDEIRELRETVKFTPVDGRYKVYIIDEVHMLTTEAFNALLKTLEEPPGHVVFVLATTEAHKVPATIQSRCQRYDFKRITAAEIEKRLAFVAQETKLAVEPEALRLIALQADGGMRDALSILDQCSALDEGAVDEAKVRGLLGLIGREWIVRITDALMKKDAMAVLKAVDTLVAEGKDLRQVLMELALHMRSVMIFQATGGGKGMALDSGAEGALAEQSGGFTYQEIVRAIQKIHAALNEMKWSPQPRMTTEIALLSLCSACDAASAGDTAALLKRLEALEARTAAFAAGRQNRAAAMGAVSFAPAPAPPPPGEDANERRLPDEGARATGGKSAAAGDARPENVRGAEEIWKALLDSLLKNGKRSIYACVSQGVLRGYDGKQFLIGFTAAFPKERTEKNDYKEVLETLLGQLCGRPVAVRCSLESIAAAEPRPRQVNKKAETAAAADLSQSEKQIIDTAVEVFGNHFVPAETLKK